VFLHFSLANERVERFLAACKIGNCQSLAIVAAQNNDVEKMMIGSGKMQMALMFVGGVLCLSAFAETPYEKYHVAYKKISREVLRNTVGILTISSGAQKGTTLRTYLWVADQFIPAAEIKVIETTPISSFGDHAASDSTSIAKYRYPIIETIDPYARIVYDPVNDRSAWINLDETKKLFSSVTVTRLNELSASLPLYVDIFCFTNSGRRKVYKSPRADDGYFIVARSEERYGRLKVMELGEGYLKLGQPRFNQTSFELEAVDPVGWIRIRDDQGQLTFWLKSVEVP